VYLFINKRNNILNCYQKI